MSNTIEYRSNIIALSHHVGIALDSIVIALDIVATSPLLHWVIAPSTQTQTLAVRLCDQTQTLAVRLCDQTQTLAVRLCDIELHDPFQIP